MLFRYAVYVQMSAGHAQKSAPGMSMSTAKLVLSLVATVPMPVSR